MAEYKVIIGRNYKWYGDGRKNLFSKIAEEILLPVVKKDIIIEVPHGSVTEPLEDGTFRIYIWSSQEGEQKELPPRTIWGIPVDCRDNGYEASGFGISITAEEGWDVGELIGDNLYIHHDICHKGTENELAIFRRLCQETAKIITEGIKEPEHRVMIGDNWGWDGNSTNKKTFCTIARQILLPVVKKDIIIEVPHGKAAELLEDGKFHIYIWSSTEGRLTVNKAPGTIWGIQVDCKDSDIEPAGLGIPITAEEGWDVGELIGDNLYIHHDICHKGTENELAIFQRLCQEVSEIISAPKETKEERLKRSCEQYIAECQGRPEKVMAELRKEITDSEKTAQALQQDLVSRIRMVNSARLRLKQMQSIITDGADKKYSEEFDSMLKIPGIEGIDVRPNRISLFTEHIYIPISVERQQKALDVGKFKANIYASSGKVMFSNLTRRGKGDELNIIHPHVHASGDPCLGNISEMIPQLIAEYEFPALAQIILQWLKSVELEEHENPRLYWPIVDWPIKEKTDGK